jgi:hypothetical protein
MSMENVGVAFVQAAARRHSRIRTRRRFLSFIRWHACDVVTRGVGPLHHLQLDDFGDVQFATRKMKHAELWPGA